MLSLILGLIVFGLVTMIVYNFYQKLVGGGSHCKKCEQRERADKAFAEERRKQQHRRKQVHTETEESDADISD